MISDAFNFHDSQDITDFPGYRICRNGNVWSCRSNNGRLRTLWKQRKPSPGRGGTMLVSLYCEKRLRTLTVGRLVLEAFVGPCPDGMECCHNDGNPANNKLDNLRWDTHQANMADAKKHGTRAIGEKIASAKISSSAVADIRSMAEQGTQIKEIAKRVGLHPSTVSRIVKGKRWKHLVGSDRRDRRIGGGEHTKVIRECACGKRIKGPSFFLHAKVCDRAAGDSQTLSPQPATEGTGL